MEKNVVQVLTYLLPTQKKMLDELSRRTRIPRAALMREAVDDLLKKHKKHLTGDGK